MECQCGGSTVDRAVIRRGKDAGRYAECTACGRVRWWWRSDELRRELGNGAQDERGNDDDDDK